MQNKPKANAKFVIHGSQTKIYRHLMSEMYFCIKTFSDEVRHKNKTLFFKHKKHKQNLAIRHFYKFKTLKKAN